MINPPVNLIAICGTTAGNIDLHWDASPDAGVTYNIYRSEVLGGPYAIETNVNALSYVDSASLVVGTTYYYVVRATDGIDESINSNEYGAAPAALGRPTVSVITVSNSDLNLSWNAVVGATKYFVDIIDEVNGFNYHVEETANTAHNYQLNVGENLLVAGTQYHVSVIASDNINNSCATFKAFTPSGLVLNNLQAVEGNLEVVLTWDQLGDGTATYDVFRSTTSGGPYTTIVNQAPITALTYTDATVAKDVTYYYIARAVFIDDTTSQPSNEAFATPYEDTPASPTFLSAVPGDSVINLVWSGVLGDTIDGYNIYRSNTPGGPYVKLNYTLISGTFYTDTTVENYLRYFYVVRSVTIYESQSLSSNEADAIPKVQPIAQVTTIEYTDPIPTAQLFEYLSTAFQTGDKKPRARLRIYDSSGNGNVYDLTDDVISFDMDRRWDAPASECTVVLDNSHGKFSPDYNPFKFPGVELPISHFQYMFFPNTKFQIFVGYGSHLYLMFTGFIDRVNISAHSDVLEFKGRNAYKKLLTQVMEPAAGKFYYTNWIASDIIADLVTKAGLTVEFDTTQVLEGGILIPYVIPGVSFEYGQIYHDGINQVLETIYHRLYGTRLGTIRLEQIDFKNQTDVEDYTYDDIVYLKNMQYNIDDLNIRTHVRVSGGGGADTFRDDYLWKVVCLGERRVASVQAPWWADTTAKRELIAKSIFLQMTRKLRLASFAAVGNPALEIGDLIRLSERISTVTAKYQVSGIKTHFDRSTGYHDIIDVEYAANEPNVRIAPLNFQTERFEELVYAQRFKSRNLDSKWAATFANPTPGVIPFKAVLNFDWGDNTNAWSLFASGDDGAVPQGGVSEAIFDYTVPNDGFEYEWQFDLTLSCDNNDAFNLIVDGVVVVTLFGSQTWRHSERRTFAAGAHRVIWRFTKFDPEGGEANRPYGYMAIGDVEVYKVTYS